jgi:hypothetical protein
LCNRLVSISVDELDKSDDVISVNLGIAVALEETEQIPAMVCVGCRVVYIVSKVEAPDPQKQSAAKIVLPNTSFRVFGDAISARGCASQILIANIWFPVPSWYSLDSEFDTYFCMDDIPLRPRRSNVRLDWFPPPGLQKRLSSNEAELMTSNNDAIHVSLSHRTGQMLFRAAQSCYGRHQLRRGSHINSDSSRTKCRQ